MNYLHLYVYFNFQAVLLQLVQDLKDEGNHLFKSGRFQEAATHYKQALFVVRVLDERFYHEVDGDFLTTLHANGALSFLKIVSINTYDIRIILRSVFIKVV